MKQKLIFLDVDGTLVEPGTNQPPASALEAIRLARANGHRLVLCSGRNRGMLSPLLGFGFDGFIGSAGGYIVYWNQVIYDCPMTPRQQARVLSVLDENGVYYTLETFDHSYTASLFRDFLRDAVSRRANSELLRWQKQLENDHDTRPITEYRAEPVYKMVFASRGMERLRVPMQILQDDFYFCIQDLDARQIVNGDLINRTFNKGTAVHRLCAYLGVDPADTIAFGDSMNDREMLEAATFGICMGNGNPTLQQLAQMVCPPLAEDGLHRAFEALGLI